VEYSYLNASNGISRNMLQPILSINDVVIHTPLIVNLSTVVDKKWIQKVSPVKDKNYLVLGQTFQLRLSKSGAHLSAPGYLNIDSSEFTGKREVRFSFDVSYNGSVLLKMKWHPLPHNLNVYTFQLSNRAIEGEGLIEIRDYSRSCLDKVCSMQHKSNVFRSHEAVFNQLKIEKIGRILDFRITNIEDKNWSSILQSYTTPNKAATFYYASGREAPFDLPIRIGSHTKKEMQGKTVKLGRVFNFSLRTMGDYGKVDRCVCVMPRFFYVNRNGVGREEIDIFTYEIDNNSMLKLKPWIPIPIKMIIDQQFFTADYSYEQKWSGQYYLPTNAVAISKKNKKIIPNYYSGYLLLHFDMFTAKTCNTKITQPFLRYNNHPFGNQWSNEGFNRFISWGTSKVTTEFGDIIYFEWATNVPFKHFITN
jgi:hypothetical protein